MANELNLSLSFQLNPFTGIYSPNISIQGFGITVTGRVISSGTQLIGTTKENLLLQADHAVLGWCFMRNLDTTNFVAFGADADTPFGEMLPREPALFRLSRGASAVSLKADTDACRVAYIIVET